MFLYKLILKAMCDFTKFYKTFKVEWQLSLKSKLYQSSFNKTQWALFELPFTQVSLQKSILRAGTRQARGYSRQITTYTVATLCVYSYNQIKNKKAYEIWKGT